MTWPRVVNVERLFNLRTPRAGGSAAKQDAGLGTAARLVVREMLCSVATTPFQRLDWRAGSLC
jgi:hypothetical protein